MPEYFVESLGGLLVKTDSESIERAVVQYGDTNLVDMKALDRDGFPAVVISLIGAMRGFRGEEFGLDKVPNEGERLEQLQRGNLTRYYVKILKERRISLRMAFAKQIEELDKYFAEINDPRRTRIVNTKVVRKIMYFDKREMHGEDLRDWVEPLGTVSRALLIKYG